MAKARKTTKAAKTPATYTEPTPTAPVAAPEVPVVTEPVIIPTTPATEQKKLGYERQVQARDPMPAPPTQEANVTSVMLVYDIPSDSKMGNPSWFFRRRGFRVNLSCWVMPEAAIPYHYIHTMREEHKADVSILKFDAGEAANIVKKAIVEVNKELAIQAERSKAALERAEMKLYADPELEANVSAREDAEEAYKTAAKIALKRLETLMVDVKSAVRAFGIDPNRINLRDTVNFYSTLQMGYASKIAAYVKATAELRAKATLDSLGMAGAAVAGIAPTGVMADLLRDLDDNAAADALTEAFAEPTTDTDTFTLTGEEAEQTA